MAPNEVLNESAVRVADACATHAPSSAEHESPQDDGGGGSTNPVDCIWHTAAAGRYGRTLEQFRQSPARADDPTAKEAGHACCFPTPPGTLSIAVAVKGALAALLLRPVHRLRLSGDLHLRDSRASSCRCRPRLEPIKKGLLRCVARCRWRDGLIALVYVFPNVDGPEVLARFRDRTAVGRVDHLVGPELLRGYQTGVPFYKATLRIGTCVEAPSFATD